MAMIELRAAAMATLLSLFTLAMAQDAMPIQTRNHRAIALMFLRMPFAGTVMARNEKEWSLSLTSANDLRSLPPLFEDAEVERLEATYKWGLGHNREAWVSLPLLSRGGGILDPIIDWWHQHVLGWTDRVRNALPRGGSAIDLLGEYSFGSATGIGDISMGVSQQFGPNLTGSLALKVPTGDASRLLGSGGLDLGVSVDHWRVFARRWSYHVQLGLVIQGTASKLPGTRGLIDQESLAIVFHRNSRDSWIAQWQSERAPITTGVSGADASHRLITFGYRRKLSDRQNLELFFSEDRDLFNRSFPEGANVGPDFTCGLRFSMRF